MCVDDAGLVRSDDICELREAGRLYDFGAVLHDIDALVFAVRHGHYLDLDPDELVRRAGHSFAVIDCFGILDDVRIRRYFELGCEVKGMGRGHIQRIKDQVRRSRS